MKKKVIITIITIVMLAIGVCHYYRVSNYDYSKFDRVLILSLVNDNEHVHYANAKTNEKSGRIETWVSISGVSDRGEWFTCNVKFSNTKDGFNTWYEAAEDYNRNLYGRGL